MGRRTVNSPLIFPAPSEVAPSSSVVFICESTEVIILYEKGRKPTEIAITINAAEFLKPTAFAAKENASPKSEPGTAAGICAKMSMHLFNFKSVLETMKADTQAKKVEINAPKKAKNTEFFSSVE